MSVDVHGAAHVVLYWSTSVVEITNVVGTGVIVLPEMDSAEELDGKAVSEEDGSGDKEEFVEGEVETIEVDLVLEPVDPEFAIDEELKLDNG